MSTDLRLEKAVTERMAREAEKKRQGQSRRPTRERYPGPDGGPDGGTKHKPTTSPATSLDNATRKHYAVDSDVAGAGPGE